MIKKEKPCFICGGMIVWMGLFVAFQTAQASTSENWGKNWGKVTPEEKSVVAPADYPEANAVILFDRAVLSVTANEMGIKYKRHIRIKVLSKAGADEAGNAEIIYHEGDAIKSLRAHTILPNGETIKVDKKDFFTKTSGSFEIVTFAFPSLDSGCIIEYSYGDLNNRYSNLDPWYFQDEIYTLQSQFTLVLAPGFTYSSSFSNAPRGFKDPITEEDPNPDNLAQPFMSFTWTQNNLPPIKEEQFMGAQEDYYSSLNYQLESYKSPQQTFNYIRNWNELGKEFQDYLDEYTQSGNADELSAKLTSGLTTQEEKLSALYEHVTRDYKTESNSGRWLNNDNLKAFLKAGYGSAEEKNILLAELLKKSGIQAWPVLISTRGNRKFNPQSYHLSQFNHILTFAQLDSSVIFLDASSRHCPLGMLPPSCLVDGGFLVDGKESQLVNVLRVEPRNYRLDVTNLLVDSSQIAHCSTRCTFLGYFAPEYGDLSEKSDLKEFISGQILDEIGSPYSYDTGSISTDSSGLYALETQFTMNDYVQTLDNNVVLKPISYYMRENPFKNTKRFFPVDFNFPFTYHSMMSIRADRTVSSVELPKNLTLEIAGVKYIRQASFADGVILIDSRLIVSQTIFVPSEYDELRKLFESIAQAQEDDIVMTCQ
ncbi:MAG: DUF3857 and transglutaminase domain-containing protein [candidate division Zixibacteria bacterium]|nr:DUF3857 and transglutaminase domain-containing protein [candidate division Zixibacteria bacterium]